MTTNNLKTGLLLIGIAALAIFIGRCFFGVGGAVIGLLVAFAFQAFSYFQGHKLALRFAHAEPLPPGALPWLEDAVARLSHRAGIPAPALYLSPDPQPNAFAAGRNPEVAVVCFNQGLLNTMTKREIVAVLAHELAHIRNRDTLTMTVVAALASFVTMLANVAWLIPSQGDEDRNPLVDLAMMLVVPIAAMLVQLAISRAREFAADQTAAELMGDAEPMADALLALERGVQQIPSRAAQPAMAHMYIASPLAGGLGSLLSTHPPIAQRVARLRTLRV